jgi:tetratricopeptide (TPR) repeat protein
MVRFSRSILLMGALLAGPAMAVAEADPSAQRAVSEAEAAMRLSRSPRAAVHLIRLHALRDEISDLSLFARTYQQISNQPRAHPTARALARVFAADVERARGKLNRADELVRSLGYLHDFYVLGSFDNEGKGGCETDFGPESRLDLKASYPVKTHSTSWRKLSWASPDGYVDLAAALRPRHEAIGYALTFLKSDHPRRVNLAVGASGAFRLWVNGQLAASEDRYNLPRPDQARVSVQLGSGLNPVLVKVCQDSGPFGFYLRQEDARESVKPQLPEAAGPWPKGLPPKAEKLPTLTSLLEKAVQSRPEDAELRGEYASALGFLRSFDEREHTDVSEAEQAADMALQDVSLRLLAARLQEDDANLRRKHLELALKANPRSPEARLQLAQLEMVRGYPERALKPLEELVREKPAFAAARLALVRTHDALGEWPRAAAAAEASLQDFPHLPSMARDAGRVSKRLERYQEAAARFRVALALRYDDANSRRSLISLLTDMGRVEEAAQEMRLMLRLDPFDNATRLRLGELFFANARVEEGQRLFAEAKSLCPDDPEVYEREGRALLQAGQRAQAVAAFEQSLQLRPQNPSLREAWRSLKGEKSSPGTEYVFDLAPLAKEADSISGEDSAYLVDYTYVRVQANGLSSRFQQTGVKVYTQRGVESFRSFPITYSPDRQEVRILRATVTKPDGSVVESYSESERSLNAPWSRMYYDARAKTLSFPSLAPGDVLEVRYRIEDTALDNLLSDYWGDVDYVETVAPKLRYLYIADMPPGRGLYWNKSGNHSRLEEVEQTQPDGRMLYRWSGRQIPKVIPEPSMPGWAEVVPTLHVSTYKNWEQVGRYYWGLVRDQLQPNQELRRTVTKALQGVDRKSELAVIRAIYNFVVSNTRYVALEFGIHGYKPYRVDRVLARRYGDCKDKASLIYAMLKVAGIDSRLVLLRMRQLGSIGEEPASLAAFNHAIVFVPKHNLFLDGTAEFHNARELPSADRLANVLIVEPSGRSSFLQTPEARAEDNTMRTVLEVALRENGSAQILGESTVSGQNAPEYRRSYQTAATRKATFEQGWAQVFPGLTVEDVRLSDLGNLDSDVSLRYQLSVPRFAEALPKMLRFYPFGGSRSFAQTYAPLSERKYDLVLQHPWVNQYVFTYRLPEGFTAVDLPADLAEDTPFGKMRLSYRLEGGTVVCRAEVALTKTRIQVNEYASFRALLGRLDQAFSRKIQVSVRNGQTAQK